MGRRFGTLSIEVTAIDWHLVMGFVERSTRACRLACARKNAASTQGHAPSRGFDAISGK